MVKILATVGGIEGCRVQTSRWTSFRHGSVVHENFISYRAGQELKGGNA